MEASTSDLRSSSSVLKCGDRGLAAAALPAAPDAAQGIETLRFLPLDHIRDGAQVFGLKLRRMRWAGVSLPS